MDKRRIAAMLAAVSARVPVGLRRGRRFQRQDELPLEGRGWPPPSVRCFLHASQASGQSRRKGAASPAPAETLS
jgi:hypothetical protein